MDDCTYNDLLEMQSYLEFRAKEEKKAQEKSEKNRKNKPRKR